MTSLNAADTQPEIRPVASLRVRGQGRRVIGALMLREMSTTYGRSPGGYIWAVIEPVGMISIMALAFSMALRAPSLGTSFLLFYTAGYLPLRFFQLVSQSVGTAVKFNQALMTYPRVTIFDTIAARAFLAILTQIMVTAVIIAGVFALEDVREHIDYGPILKAYGACLVLAFGIGTFNCYMLIRFAIWKSLWGILTRPLLFISGVFYTYEDLPQVAQDILWYNPLIHVSGGVRSGIYSTYDPQYISLLYVCMVGIIPMTFGALLLWRYGRDMLN